MINILKSLDFFSQSPHLRVNGRNKLATIFGSAVSIFSIIILIFGISFILYDYFFYLTYNINSYTDNTITPEIDLKALKFGLLLTNGRGEEYQNPEKLFKISAALWEIKTPILGNISDVSVSLKDIPIMKCNEYKNNPILNKEFNSYSKIFDLNCLDFESLNRNLTGTFGNLKG